MIFFSPSVVSSSPKCQKSSKKRKQGTLKPFSQNYIVYSISVIFWLLSLLRTIFFYVYHVLFKDNILLCLLCIIPFSTFGNWGCYFLYFTKRGCEVTEKAFRIVSYYLQEHMGKSFGGSLVHCKKRFWTWLLAFPVFERTQCREPKYQMGDMECAPPMPRRLFHKFMLQLTLIFPLWISLNFNPTGKLFFLEWLLSHPQ